MNTRSEPSRGHTSRGEDPHKHDQQDGGSGDVHIGQNEEPHVEKPSMMKRVRAKARKIKDSIKRVGHAHDHDHDHDHDEVVADDDDDDDMDTDSERHSPHTSQSVMSGKEGVARQHESKLEGRIAAEGEPTTSKPGDYQTFDPTTTKYALGQDETTLGWSRTDTGRPTESEEQPYAPKSTPVVATHLGGGQSTGDSEIRKEEGHSKLGGGTGGSLGGVEENYQAPKGIWGHHSPENYQAEVANSTNLGYDFAADLGVMPEGHGSKSGEKTAMEGVTNDHLNKSQGDHHTFDTDPASYARGQEATLRAEEASNTSKDSPFAAHSGGEEIWKTPVLNQFDRMNIHREPHQIQNIASSQEESRFETGNSPRDRKSSRSHDQFEIPESGTHGLGDEGWHNKSELKQETYAGMASSAGAMMADKANQDTSSATSKQGYSDTFDKQSSAVQGLHKKHSEPGGNVEKLSIATAVVADKVVQAKDVVATKLGYGDSTDQQSSAVQGVHEKHSEPGSNAEKSSIDTTVVADKPVQAKDAVATNLGYGDSTDQQSSAVQGLHEKHSKPGGNAEKLSIATGVITNKVVQAKDVVATKLVYGDDTDHQSFVVQGLHEKHSKQGGNAEKSSIDTTVVADKAAQAKDVVATNLGYGDNTDQQSFAVQGLHEKHSEPRGNAEKLSVATDVVADKVVQAKDTVATKLGYGEIHEAGPTTTRTDTSDGTVKGVSMKEYLVEKLKPGEDDKALSEVITEALPLHKRKEDVSKNGEEEEGRKAPIKGMTDSEEVATRLGRSEDTSYDKEAGTGLASHERGVMARMIDAATSWYNNTGVSPAEDIKEGREGSSSIMTCEDDGADGQYKVTKD